MAHDIAVVIMTVCRNALLRAVRSVFQQRTAARIQILVGVDCDPHGRGAAFFKELTAEVPPNCRLTWFDLGYSTSVRNGGLHSAPAGGSLRSALTLLADAEIVAYLDDDDWYAPEHCEQILAAVQDRSWAFAYSIYADGDIGEGLCIDEIESVGVNKGLFAERFGGFVRPSALAIHKLKLLPYIHLFSVALLDQGIPEDRVVFSHLKELPHACTGNATVFYAIDPRDLMHPHRLALIRQRQGEFRSTAKEESLHHVFFPPS